MASKHDSPNSDPDTEAKILFEVAKELCWLADQATERARAAFARIDRPLPLFDRDDSEEGR